MAGKKGQLAWNKGKKLTEKHTKNLSISHMGFNPTKETREKLSKSHKGEHHPNWKGGISQRYRKLLAPRPQPDICEVCGAFVGKGKQGIHYDHNHKTGKFRGWLCARCNIVLGFVKDNTETLQALIEYIKKSQN